MVSLYVRSPPQFCPGSSLCYWFLSRTAPLPLRAPPRSSTDRVFDLPTLPSFFVFSFFFWRPFLSGALILMFVSLLPLGPFPFTLRVIHTARFRQAVFGISPCVGVLLLTRPPLSLFPYSVVFGSLILLCPPPLSHPRCPARPPLPLVFFVSFPPSFLTNSPSECPRGTAPCLGVWNT